MYIPLRGCCTDSPGCDDLPTTRQIFLTLSWVFGVTAVLVWIAVNLPVFL